ncbi:ASCH domain-containing protein [Mycolicibacterium palauense]|uniref:hypothetical protein n=1 Tax=Mycolicibacterium palauense TaxID=2034511 RepID=UPI000BFEDAD3|nr:hypothetical protein [Mycolicibacterium palauense]
MRNRSPNACSPSVPQTAVRAITVQQPWAWAIVSAGKNVENRTQAWAHRGRLLIHAGGRWSERGGQSELVRTQWARQHPGNNVIQHGALPEWLFAAAAAEKVAGVAAGAFVGVVDLVDVHPDIGCCKPWGESSYTEHGGRERRRVAHLILENARPLPEPVACRGSQGLWVPPPDVVQRCEVAQ